jgi:hypothetical protein
MRLRVTFLLLAAMLVASCQPQIIYVVYSPTPEPTETAATPEVTETTAPATALSTEEAIPTAAIQAATEVVTAPTAITPQEILPSTTTPPTETPAPQTPSATSPPPNFPTPVFAQIQVAEQLFEHGRMFWLQPTQEIWVLIVTSEGRGTWLVYEDTFVEGEPETDPAIVAPDGLLQPERGFGKLWREVQQVRDELGWAVTPEFGYVSRYEYHAGGTVDAQGNYVRGFGYHVLYSLYGELFRFNEENSTWQLGGG